MAADPRTRFAVDVYLAKRAELNAALQEIQTLKLTLRQLVAEIGPRMTAIETRSVLLSKTVGTLLAELDQNHAATVTLLRQATPAKGAIVLTPPPEDLNDTTRAAEPTP